MDRETVSELERLRCEVARLVVELAQAKSLMLWLAERIHAQHDILQKRAENANRV